MIKIRQYNRVKQKKKILHKVKKNSNRKLNNMKIKKNKFYHS